MKLVEGTDNLYHYAPIGAALKILKSGQFELASMEGNSSENQWAPKGHSFYLSTTRSKVGDYHTRPGNSAVIFNLDGRWLNQRYVVKPIDYWEGMWIGNKDGRTSESEDRVFSKTPEIPFTPVQSVHLLYKENGIKTWNHYARNIMIEAKKADIPVYLYGDTQSWLTQDKRKVINVKDAGDRLKGPSGQGETRRRKAPYLLAWIELYHKRNLEDLGDKALKQARSLVGQTYSDNADYGLGNDLRNAAMPNAIGRDAALKILKLMKQHNQTKPIEFANALREKWLPKFEEHRDKEHAEWQRVQKLKQKDDEEYKTAMQTESVLTEVFDNPYDWQWVDNRGKFRKMFALKTAALTGDLEKAEADSPSKLDAMLGDIGATFDVEDDTIWVMFHNVGGVWSVVFDSQLNKLGKDKTYTSTNAGHAGKVLATVIEIMKAFTDKFSPKSLRFLANDKKRASVYKAIARKFRNYNGYKYKHTKSKHSDEFSFQTESVLTEARGNSIILVDFQPAYQSDDFGYDEAISNAVQYINAKRPNVTAFYNGSDVGIEDTADDVAWHYIEHGLDEDLANNINFKEKSYAWLRSWMDQGVEPSTIIKVVRYMVMNDMNDSRDIIEQQENGAEIFQKLVGEDGGEWMHDDGIYLPDISIGNLQSLSGSLLGGGGQHECLKEMQLFMNAFNIKYKLVNDWIYG